MENSSEKKGMFLAQQDDLPLKVGKNWVGSSVILPSWANLRSDVAPYFEEAERKTNKKK